MSHDSTGPFDKARGYVIRGHELGMGLAIVALTFIVATLVVGIAMLLPESISIKSQKSYQLGYDVGVYCDTDPRSCSVICKNNLEQEYHVAECTRGVYNGYNAKADFDGGKGI